MQINNILKEPLAHFALIGIVIFVFLSALKPAENDDRIIVDRGALLTFIQYRSKAFEPSAAAALLDNMSDQDRKNLITDYVREEALYREAKKLSFETNDYVIKQRMIQKMEFMTEAVITGDPTDIEIKAYYDKHRLGYAIAPNATFTHIFISTKNKDKALAKKEAEILLAELNQTEASFADATRYGDRFLFHTNYVDRTFDYIRSHFGHDATTEIFSTNKSLNKWFGPAFSEHGAHLFYVTKVSEERIPPLEEVKDKVTEDAKREKNRIVNEKNIQAIVGQYDVVMTTDS